MDTNDLISALSRKKRLGRAASYRKLAKKVGVNVKTVHVVLNNGESGMKIDRERIVRRVHRALDEIEAELQEAEANEAA